MRLVVGALGMAFSTPAKAHGSLVSQTYPPVSRRDRGSGPDFRRAVSGQRGIPGAGVCVSGSTVLSAKSPSRARVPTL